MLAEDKPNRPPRDKGRSVVRAKPLYAEANRCGAATRSLAAPHGSKHPPTRKERAGRARARSREAAYLRSLAAKRLVKRNPAGRPVGREDLADQVLLRDEAPHTRVARRLPVVAHHQVVVLRDPRIGVPRRDVR